MASETEEERQISCFQGFSKAMLTLINMAFLVVGSLFIYLGVYIIGSGWIEVFSDSFSWVKPGMIYAIVGFGAVTLISALIGCIGTCLDNRMLLRIYLILVALSLCMFVVIAIAGFLTSGTANDWSRMSYPAASDETKLAIKFNTAYCYAYGHYYCHEGNVTTGLNILFPTVPTEVTDVLTQARGINNACNLVGDLADISSIQPACDVCADTTAYSGYEGVFYWAEKDCPLNTNTVNVNEYCRVLLASGKLPVQEFTGSPYGMCRDPLLDFLSDWSGRIGIFAATLGSFALALILFICCTIKQPGQKGIYEPSFIRRDTEEQSYRSSGSTQFY